MHTVILAGISSATRSFTAFHMFAITSGPHNKKNNFRVYTVLTHPTHSSLLTHSPLPSCSPLPEPSAPSTLHIPPCLHIPHCHDVPHILHSHHVPHIPHCQTPLHPHSPLLGFQFSTRCNTPHCPAVAGFFWCVPQPPAHCPGTVCERSHVHADLEACNPALQKHSPSFSDIASFLISLILLHS